MKKLLSVVGYLATMALLVSCGGDNSILNAGSSGGPSIASIDLLAGSPQLPSDSTGGNTVPITAVVKDALNNIVVGATVTFSATSGSLTVTQNVSDATGAAFAKISNGQDPTNRTITITAQAGNTTGQATATVNVDVTGTALQINGPTALAQGDSANYQVQLKDSKGVGISGRTLTVTSATGNNLTNTPTPLVTNVTGAAQVSLVATTAGADTLTVSALGISSNQSVTVSNDVFTIVTPAANIDINLGVSQTIKARWIKGGVPQQGATIQFSSTRGTLSSGSAVTDVNGEASVTVSANNAGPAVFSAVNPDLVTTKVNANFIATTSTSMDLQATPFTVGSGDQSQIDATIRDAVGNLVKNKTVVFQLTDVTGGFLSAGSAVTNAQGRAQTFYTGGSVPSQLNGVTIDAYVQDNPAVTGQVKLTVAHKELFIAIGTGNLLFTPTSATFAKEWVILVTDVNGNAVANKQVQAGIRSVHYRKGQLEYQDCATGKCWRYDTIPVAVAASYHQCDDEDSNNNGILDPTEDNNGNGKLEAGNIALVAAVPDSADPANPCAAVGSGATSAQADVMTNAQGQARVCVFYPRNYNLWLEARIEAKASVQGTEFSEHQVWVLPALASDLTNSADPPGRFSPFGVIGDADPVLDCKIPPP